ncbi:MAG: iron-containing alcohol dehydrogenase [Firmicutes bacterium]|nr:iron-containing alcohol dehydrogenase [Bacillota bacterium]
MQTYSFFMPTKIIHGEKELLTQAQQLTRFGGKCLLVTGKNSARVSGALDDAIKALKSQGIKYEHFDRVESNPSLANVAAGGEVARQYEPDFILAIGGGSPLDAAKAIATLATNQISPEELYSNEFAHTPLPIIAIPTTAGTGSEVTPYSILTIPAAETKRSFSVPELFPKIAFLDRRYTERLPVSITRDTAVDALSHLVEGYLSRRAIGTSDIFAERGIRLWAQCITALREGEFSPEDRDRLLVASTLGGITISHTGTTFVHSLGYSLTYYHDIPHGRANGMLMGEYLRYTQEYAPQRVSNVLSWLGLADISEFAAIVKELSGSVVELTDQEIKAYAAKAMGSRNVGYSQGEVTEAVLQKVLRNS